MALKSDSRQWGLGAQLLHWVMALLIIGAGIVGWYMTDLPNSPQKMKIYAMHKSVGLTVLALVLLRLVWRWRDNRPADVPMPAWQARAAHAVHVLLYGLMLVMPLSGWLYNSASGYPLRWFGMVNLPSLTGGQDAALKSLAHEVHEWGFYLLAALLLAHAGAALKHHFIDRDETLARMLPFLRRRTAPAVESAPAATPIPSAASPDQSPESRP
ncbi:cytochrome b [Tahibacter amnicola]|uniref:Cytochrome b n=1 Tax=Tahibacter amnicola TaxID=2976241 RepID=A0ABY6BNE0_9GAMM|nr:cytochrome b [Tahibacter amnicola]UXI69327.1 cytochrome b [Tahibacter amnicola]